MTRTKCSRWGRSGRSCRPPSRSRRRRCRRRSPRVLGAVADLDLGQERGDRARAAIPPVGARPRRAPRPSPGEVRNSEMISTERTPAIRPRHRDRRVLGLGLQQIGERVAHDVVEVQDRLWTRIGPLGHGVVRQISLRQPADRAALESTTRGWGTSAPFSFARTSLVDWPTNASGACQRSMSRTRISARRLRARSASTKSSTKSSAGAISSSAASRTGRGARPARGSRSGRPS